MSAAINNDKPYRVPDSRLAAGPDASTETARAGTPHRFRRNNAAVTGLMELQFDRYREVGLNRYADTSNSTESPSQDNKNVQGNQEVAALIAVLTGVATFAADFGPAFAAKFRDPECGPEANMRDP
ncbi:MAG: hypothetical protein R3C56_36055 [Pirellulaceae bacterium]